MQCNKCGTLNFDNVRYCSNCNHELHQGIPTGLIKNNLKPIKFARSVIYFSVLISIIGIVAAIAIPTYHETILSLTKDTQRPIETNKHVVMGEESILSKKALDAYRNIYKYAKLHKAFAQASSGAWAYKYGVFSAQKAKSITLDNCKKHNTGKPCRLINVDNEWVN